ncbi:MAG: YitT family protein [Deferrisomatales bacterium]|nr:YitT family protein [Deferrisomatales bacterium]
MEATATATTLQQARQMVWNLLLLAVGSALCALALNGILLPHRFASPGVTGVALLIHYQLPSLPVSALYLVLNVPLFALGWFHVGRRFLLYSLAGAILFSVAVAIVQFPIQVEDKILAALLAGVLTGTGAGIILRSQGSAGGTDILAVMLFRRFSIRLGTTSLAFNVLVLAAALLLFDVQTVLYTVIFIYVSAQMVDLVVTGLSKRKAVTIVSRRWKEIERAIIDEIKRGVTVMEGAGGYSGEPEKILYTVITFRELSRLKHLIRELDPAAFVVVTDTLEVIGQRIGNQPHW